MDKEQFGKLLMTLRKRKGMSQKEFADILLVSTSAVSKWEHGKNLPDMTMINKIAEVFNVSCDALHNPEKTLLYLMNPELQKEEGESKKLEEEEKSLQKKRKRAITLIAIITTTLAVLVGLCLFYASKKEPTFQQVATRYIDDPVWGSVYEIACVVHGEMDVELMNAYLDKIREGLIGQEDEIDTNIVKTSYYDNKKDAMAWKEVEYFGYIFLDVE